MKTGFRGAFVIAWTQTELDGLPEAPVSALAPGAVWNWRGDVLRVDGPADILRLDRSQGKTEVRQRAARMVQRLVGAAFDPVRAEQPLAEMPVVDTGFVVSDGAQKYTVTLIDTGRGRPLLMFLDEIPPRDQDMWVVQTHLPRQETGPHVPEAPGVICFTPGTRIATETGPRLIETLGPGDRILTMDNGPQEIVWAGSRRMTGARFFAMPELRPVRVRGGALGMGQPDGDLVVSPDHKMLIEGPVAQDLFNVSGVLVSARDLVDEQKVCFATVPRALSYIHILLPRHEIIWANGVPSESFHPGHADLQSLSSDDRSRLFAAMPELATDTSYGGEARRVLNRSEAAILAHAA